MAVESATYIADLNSANPAGSADRSESDNHHRLIKACLLATLPNLDGVVNATDTELNYVVGTTSAIQTQLNALASISLNTQNTNYTLVLGDANKSVYKSNTSAYAWTIPPNSSVAFPTGTTVMMMNNGSSGAITITRGSGVVLRIAGIGGDANRTLSPYGLCTIIKVGTDEWYVTGTGVA